MPRRIPQVGQPGVKSRKYPRTFTGCRTCRKRHVKCDNERPSCGPCQQFGRACDGYWSTLRWSPRAAVNSTTQQHYSNPPAYRFPVLSETQRHRMSDEISKSLGTSSAPDLLAHLDNASLKLEYTTKPLTEMTRGPFGVFSVDDRSVRCRSSPINSVANLAEHENDVIVVDEHGDEEDDDDDDAAVVVVNGNLDNNSADYDAHGKRPNDRQSPEQLTEGMAFPEWDLGFTELVDYFALPSDLTFGQDTHCANGPGRVSHSDPMFSNSLLEASTGGDPFCSGSQPLLLTDTNIANRQNIFDDSSLVSIEASGIPIFAPDLVPANRPVLPAHSEVLLRHYKHVIFESLQNQSRGASPWQLIFFPSALRAFAELSLFRDTSHTRYAILSDLLALSAFHMHVSGTLDSRGGSWLSTGIQLQQQAQSHLRAALKKEVAGPGRAKYEELLMAILAVSMISLSKRHQHFEVFLLDAERIIRKWGLAQEIPFEFRLLHHMYCHLRVLAECVGAHFESPTDGPVADFYQPPAKGGRFCLAEECYSIGLNPTFEKDPDLGYTDIHLQVQGQWNKTLFPVIYGFPETLWTLVSQTVATANEQTRIAALNPPRQDLASALQQHIRGLERTVWNQVSQCQTFGPSRPERPASVGDPSPLDTPLARLLTQGLHQALILFFYRKIYNLSPMPLQDTVRRALDYLEPCMERIDTQDLTICLAWAALTTACEAASPDLQHRALKMLEFADKKEISLTPVPLKQMAVHAWEKF